MRGLMNNPEAVKVLNNLMGSMVNRIHHIYNLGYTEGYKDAVEEVKRKLYEYANGMMERRADELNHQRHEIAENGTR